jgi:hypothetical protein
MNQIDFPPGSHGNYLATLICLFIYKNFDYSVVDSWFLADGSSHVIGGMIGWRTDHMSLRGIDYRVDDRTIRIQCEPDDMLCLLTNRFARAGNVALDLDNLHVNTKQKLHAALPKTASILQEVDKVYPDQDHVPRWYLQRLFLKRLQDPRRYVPDCFTWCKDAGEIYVWAYKDFFELDSLCRGLHKLAQWIGVPFVEDAFIELHHREFLAKNQGYQSMIKMRRDLSQFRTDNNSTSVIEEAYIRQSRCIPGDFVPISQP